MKPGKKKDPPVLVGTGGRTAAGSSATAEVMRCVKLYQYSQVRGLRIPKAQVPAHFAIGSLFAAMRREWFGRKFDTSEKVWTYLKRKCQQEAEEQRELINQKDEAFALALMGKYIEHWSVRPRPTPLAAELELGPIPLVKGGPFNMARTAKLDDLSKYPEAGGALCIGEAKTTSGDVNAVIREYELHVQTLLYQAVYRAAEQGQVRYGKVAGTVLDIVVKPETGRKASFARVFVEIRPSVVEAFVESAQYYLAMANKVDWDTPTPRNFDNCTKMHGRMRVDCTFKDLCRFGSSAAGRYVMPDGSPLRKHKPVPGAERMPWE
jgi:hypothetical protein